jgi:hypothetical protein
VVVEFLSVALMSGRYPRSSAKQTKKAASPSKATAPRCCGAAALRTGKTKQAITSTRTSTRISVSAALKAVSAALQAVSAAPKAVSVALKAVLAALKAVSAALKAVLAALKAVSLLGVTYRGGSAHHCSEMVRFVVYNEGIPHLGARGHQEPPVRQ